MDRGIWICFSGIDGTGKTSLCRYAVKILGEDTAFMKIPHYDWVRDMIKISGGNSPTRDPHTDALLFAAGNRLEMYSIRDILRENSFLVTQRCWLDNFPYRAGQGIGLRQAIDILKPEKFEAPDVVFFLKCDARTAYARIKDQKGDKYESLNQMKIHEKIFEQMYKDIANHSFSVDLGGTQIITLDSNKDLKALKKELRMHLDRLGFIAQGQKNADKA